MSAVMPLQTRIVNVIRDNSPMPVKDLGRWLPDIDAIALDYGVTALMRANKVSRVNGYYDLVNSQLKRNGADRGTVFRACDIAAAPVPASGASSDVTQARLVTEPPHPSASHGSDTPGQQVSASSRLRDPARQPGETGNNLLPPTAEEEAAASLTPETQVCTDCDRLLPLKSFQFLSRSHAHSEICRECMGKRSSRAKAIKCTNTSTGATAVSPGTPHDKEPPPAADIAGGPTDTPSGHPPVVNPQTENPAGMPAESMEQAGSAPHMARAVTSLPISPTNPVAGSVAAGPMSFKDGLVRTRAVLLAWIADQEEELEYARKSLEEFDRVRELIEDLVPEALT